ncbi:MAG TPA: hypothetical protein VHE30_07490 [Polyangiaceae bacterium]|nr:hypothetical protein [Polyangiaceae bacterium]
MSSETLHVERPYDTLEQYLDGDAWTVDRSDMVLVGAAGVAAGTSVKFEIALATGEAVVRGEGRVVEAVTATNGRPGGLRVRFRQLDAASKTTLKRALEAQKRARKPEAKSSPNAAPPEAKSSPNASAAPAEAESSPNASAAPVPLPVPAPVPGAGSPAVAKVAAPVEGGNEPSGVRHRAPGPVVAPTNRDELLARLRHRGSARRRSAAE